MHCSSCDAKTKFSRTRKVPEPSLGLWFQHVKILQIFTNCTALSAVIIPSGGGMGSGAGRGPAMETGGRSGAERPPAPSAAGSPRRFRPARPGPPQPARSTGPVNPPQPAFHRQTARTSLLCSPLTSSLTDVPLVQLAAVGFIYLSESCYRIPLKLPWYPCNFAWIWFDFRRSLCLDRALKYCISSWTVF